MDSKACGGHYVTILPADLSIFTSHYTFALQFLWWKMLWNPSICCLVSSCCMVQTSAQACACC